MKAVNDLVFTYDDVTKVLTLTMSVTEIVFLPNGPSAPSGPVVVVKTVDLSSLAAH